MLAELDAQFVGDTRQRENGSADRRRIPPKPGESAFNAMPMKHADGPLRAPATAPISTGSSGAPSRSRAIGGVADGT